MYRIVETGRNMEFMASRQQADSHITIQGMKQTMSEGSGTERNSTHCTVLHVSYTGQIHLGLKMEHTPHTPNRLRSSAAMHSLVTQHRCYLVHSGLKLETGQNSLGL